MSLKKSLTGIVLALTLSTSVFAFAGCGSSEIGNVSSVVDEINGGGSTSVQKIMDAVGEEFSAQNPDVQFTYSGTGSSDGIKGTSEGTYSFGGVSRELKEDEKTNLTERVFAYDGIAIITHPSNPVQKISSENLTKIYTGEIKNWSEVGGNDEPIVVVSREDGSGTRSAVEELLDFENKLKADATVKEGNGNVQTTVAGNENAIGYVSLTYVDDTVKKLDVDGVEASVENVVNQTYPISRPFLAVFNESEVNDVTKTFLDFLMSDEGQAIVEKEGGIKVADEH